MDPNISEEQKIAFEEKYQGLIMKVADAFGQAISRGDVIEVAQLSASLSFLSRYAAERLRELDAKPAPDGWTFNFGASQ